MDHYRVVVYLALKGEGGGGEIDLVEEIKGNKNQVVGREIGFQEMNKFGEYK